MSKVVLVTGATGHLGQVVCRILSEQNYIVYGTALPNSKEASDFATIIEADLSKYSDASTVIQVIKKEHPTLHGVVCLAGGFGMSTIQTTTSYDIDFFYKLNFNTTFNITKASWDWLGDTAGGKLVFIGAKPAVEGSAFEMLPYALSKGSVIQLAEILNEASNESGISASVIVPSIIDTSANREAMPDVDFSNWVTPKEIGDQIVHLLSEGSNPLRNTVLKLYGKS